jgi:hypothetical protein
MLQNFPRARRRGKLAAAAQTRLFIGELGVRSRDGKVTDYRDEAALPNPTEAELLA